MHTIHSIRKEHSVSFFTYFLQALCSLHTLHVKLIIGNPRPSSRWKWTEIENNYLWLNIYFNGSREYFVIFSHIWNIPTGDTLLSGWFKRAKYITMHVVLRNISSRFSINSEAFAQELLENLGEMHIDSRLSPHRNDKMFKLLSPHVISEKYFLGWKSIYLQCQQITIN